MLALPKLSGDMHERAAVELQQAERTKNPVRQLSIRHPEMTIADAYEVQNARLRLKLAEGLKIRGRKVGLTSRAMRDAVGINDSDFGTLFDDTFYADGAAIPFGNFIEPKIEVELAFILKEPLSGPNVDFLQVLKATEKVIPAMEILDARIHRIDPDTKRTRTVVDTISDNAGNAGFLVGGRPFTPDAVDLRWVSAFCLQNGEVVETGCGAGVLNNPANAIAWLANALHERGEILEAGQIHLSGAFMRPVSVRKGDTIHADFGPFGSLSCHFN